MATIEDYVTCVADGCRGIYTAQFFVQVWRSMIEGVDVESLDIVEEGPDHEFFDDCWDEVIRDATVCYAGHEWSIYQDGDVFLIRRDCPDELLEDWY